MDIETRSNYLISDALRNVSLSQSYEPMSSNKTKPPKGSSGGGDTGDMTQGGNTPGH